MLKTQSRVWNLIALFVACLTPTGSVRSEPNNGAQTSVTFAEESKDAEYLVGRVQSESHTCEQRFQAIAALETSQDDESYEGLRSLFLDPGRGAGICQWMAERLFRALAVQRQRMLAKGKAGLDMGDIDPVTGKKGKGFAEAAARALNGQYAFTHPAKPYQILADLADPSTSDLLLHSLGYLILSVRNSLDHFPSKELSPGERTSNGNEATVVREGNDVDRASVWRWRYIIRGLGNLREPRAVPDLGIAYDRISDMGERSTNVRLELVTALGKIATPEAKTLLGKVASSDSDQKVRDQAQRELKGLPAR